MRVTWVTILVDKKGREYERGSGKFPGNDYARNAFMRRTETP